MKRVAIFPSLCFRLSAVDAVCRIALTIAASASLTCLKQYFAEKALRLSACRRLEELHRFIYPLERHPQKRQVNVTSFAGRSSIGSAHDRVEVIITKIAAAIAIG